MQKKKKEIFQTNPNPFAFWIANKSLSFNFSFEEYSGSKSLPKHVRAVGSLFYFDFLKKWLMIN